MALISENEVRSFVSKRTQLFESSATRLKRSAVKTFSSTDSYDVFLSHAFKDAELVEGIKLLLESKGLSGVALVVGQRITVRRWTGENGLRLQQKKAQLQGSNLPRGARSSRLLYPSLNWLVNVVSGTKKL